MKPQPLVCFWCDGEETPRRKLHAPTPDSGAHLHRSCARELAASLDGAAGGRSDTRRKTKQAPTHCKAQASEVD